MPENFLISKMLQDVINATNNNLGDDEIEKHFSNMIGEFFGIDKVVINSATKIENQQNELYGYIFNTRKTYIDNQLSEYSSFPQLISYKSRGYKSCAVVPIIVSGKVVSIVEMLSISENKFSNDLITSASMGAYITGLMLLYKTESDRSLRLAGYFNSAFNSADAQLLVSQDGKIIKANESSRKDIYNPKNVNQKIEQLIGLNFEQLFAMAKRGPANVTLMKDGEAKSYRASVSIVNEKLIHISLQDLTELRRLSVILESMDAQSYIGAFYLTKDLTVKSASESIKRSIGYDKSLVTGKNLIDLAVEKQRGELRELLQKQAAKERIHGTIDLAAANGIPAHLRFVLTKWTNGYLMLFSDATSEGYAESIRNAFTDFINNTSDIVMTMDTLGYIKDCNLPAEKVLGYSRNELIGKELRTIYSDPAILERDITFVRNGTKVDNSYVMLIDKSNNKVDATHSIRLFRGSESSDYVIVVKELETKRRMTVLDDELAAEKKRVSRLVSTGKLKSQFVYNISHELKTPITNIKGFSKLLAQGQWGDLNKDQVDALATIMEEGDRLMAIIQQVLDAAKLESEKMTLELREVDLRELGNNPTMQAMRETAEHKGLDFSWNVDYDVPNISADPNKLIQVFVNLISNSIKFTNKGSISIKITRLGRTKIKCDVTDTGIGIEDEDRHKLFKKFYEAPKKGLVKQEGAGTGLGLTIAQEIAKLHGGRITCESEPGKGSTFSLVIKIKPKRKQEN
jgi:PAS domain S-box-containing protein